MVSIKWRLLSSLSMSHLLHFSLLAISSLHIMLLLFFLTLGLVVESHGEPSPEFYWKSMLPDTVMPKAIRDVMELQHISPSDVKNGKWLGQIYSNVGQNYHEQPYELAPTDNPNPNHLSLYFLEKDIHTDSLMTLDFTTNPNNGPSFLSRKESDSIPFSSTQLPQILTRFAIKPESKEAEAMKNTIAKCERPAMKGEDKYCATSLESMVDFITSEIGKNVAAMSTETEERVSNVQEYRIANGLVKMSKNMKTSDNVVVCHRETYPYVVFYCHLLVKTRVYVVPMVGGDGTKVNAVAVCHIDTSEWNPKHFAFQMLKVKAGTSICHFLQPQQFVCMPIKPN